MTRQSLGKTFGSFFTGDLAHGQGVIADDGIADQTDIGLCGSSLLVCPSESQQIPVEFLAAAVKTFDQVIGAKFFDAARGIH